MNKIDFLDIRPYDIIIFIQSSYIFKSFFMVSKFNQEYGTSISLTGNYMDDPTSIIRRKENILPSKYIIHSVFRMEFEKI